jgi:hypothetical protein
MRIKVLTTNLRDCCPSRGHNINSNFTDFLLKTFVLSFVSPAKPTTALFIDSPGRTGGQKPGFFAERRVTDRRIRQKTKVVKVLMRPGVIEIAITQ